MNEDKQETSTILSESPPSESDAAVLVESRDARSDVQTTDDRYEDEEGGHLHGQSCGCGDSHHHHHHTHGHYLSGRLGGMALTKNQQKRLRRKSRARPQR